LKQRSEDTERVYEKERQYLQNWWEFFLYDVIGSDYMHCLPNETCWSM